MVKAQIVAALKAMTHNMNYGDRVSHILNSNAVWSEFRDQKHDLFITESNVRGYLTGKRSFHYRERQRIAGVETIQHLQMGLTETDTSHSYLCPPHLV